MTDEQEMELHEELKWAKIEAEQAHAMVASLQARLQSYAHENEQLQKAVDDMSQYISRADYCYLTKETISVLEEK